MKVLMSATGDGGTDNIVAVPAVISTITWLKPNDANQEQSGKMTLTFEQAWGAELAAGESYSGVTCTIAVIATAVLSITEAELVLKRLSDDELKGYDSINYTTFTCEEGSGNANQNFQELFTVEGGANQAFMCFAKGLDDLISDTSLQSFRCSLNNIDVTDRDVVVKSPLYYDRLAQSLRGMGRSFNNGVMNSGVSDHVNWNAVFTKAEASSLPLVASLFSTDSNKFLQIRTVSGAGGIGAYQLFKSIPKVFNY